MRSFILFTLMFIASFNLIAQDIPPINREIIAYVDSKMNRKVGSGECWDFAAEALRKTNANWDGLYNFGRRLNPAKDTIYPGDIIQFEKVVVETRDGNSLFRESMGHHTAIVYKVISPGKFDLAHQNYGKWGRKVGVSSLDLTNIVKGEITFFRPERK